MNYDDNELNRAKSALALAESFEENEENEITRPNAGLIADALTIYAKAYYDLQVGRELGEMERSIIAGYADEIAHDIREGVSVAGPTDSELCIRALKFYGGERAAEAA